MSQVIDTKVVEMQFDNSKFEKNIQMSLNSLQLLNKNVENAGKNRNSLDELTKASDNLGMSLENISLHEKISLNIFTLLQNAGVSAFNKISDAVAGFAMNLANSLSGMQAMKDGFAEYELKMGSVQTILNGAKILDSDGKNIEDSAKRLDIVNQKLGELNTYSDKTIYSFKDMTSNIGKFTNAGVNLDGAVGAIQGVANVAAVSGANANEASRAMYNFSQALSSGAVKLIDWKSIENANMATMDFKQQLLDTAVALGTVVKNGNTYDSLTTSLQGKTAEAFNATKGFNDSLSAQWMTTEVLTQTLKNYSTDVREMSAAELEAYKTQLKSVGYTDKQIEGIVKLSKKAFEAATEVKTFSQMIDTLKESLGSGWAQTWETIFGDFEESKRLWTGLNNTIDGILSSIGKARNAILEVWKADGGRDAMINSFKNLWQAIQNLFAPLKDLWKALTPNTEHSGKILATIFKGIEKLTAVVSKAAGIIGKVIATLMRPIIFLGNYVGKGLVKLVGIIRNAFSKIVGFFTPIGKTFSNFLNTITTVFDKHVISRIKLFQSTIADAFKSITTSLKNSSVLAKLIGSFKSLKAIIQDTFGRVTERAGLYVREFTAYLKRLWEAIAPLISSAFLKVLKTIADLVLPRLNKVLTWVIDRLKEFGQYLGKLDISKTRFYKGLVELPNKIKELSNNKTLKAIAESIRNFGGEAIQFLSDKFKSLKANLDSIKMPKGLSDVFSNVKNFISGIFGKESINADLTDAMDKTAESADKIANEDSGKKLTLFQKFLGGIADAFRWLVNAANEARKALGKFISFVITNTPKAFKALYNFIAGDDGIMSFSDVADILESVSYSLSTLMTSMGILGFSKGIGSIGEAFGELTTSLNSFLKQSANKEKMAAIKDFAIALGILSGALYVLSKIPREDLIGAVTALGIVGLGLIKFFDQIASTDFTATKVAGNLSIAALLISIGVAMAGIAASIGLLVGALAIFPKVIKQYSNLGDEFKTGMERVGEVMAQIFEYLDHSINGKYALRSAAAIYILAAALGKLRKAILDFSTIEDDSAWSAGLFKIKNILTMLGDFFSSIMAANILSINVGINFNSVGIAAMIWAMGDLLTKIVPVIQEAGQIPISEVSQGMDVITKILWRLGIFLTAMNAGSLFKVIGGGTNLRQWIGISLTLALVTNAIGSIVGNIETLSKVASGANAEGFDDAIDTIQGIFIGLSILMVIIGQCKPAGAGVLFALATSISLLTICVTLLTPIAAENPSALAGAVGALGGLMISLGVALFLAQKASGKTSPADIAKLIVMTLSMVLLASAMRRLAKVGDPESLVAAGLAISGAAMAMAGALFIIGKASLNPMALGALALLALAIWGVVFAIRAFKGTSGSYSEGAAAITKGNDEMKTSMEDTTNNMAAYAYEALPPIFTQLGETIGKSLKETFSNFDLSETLRNMINTVKSDAKNWAQDFLEIGTNIVDGISQALSDPGNADRVKECMANLGRAIVDGFKNFLGINSPSTVMIEQGGYVIDGLVQGLMEYPAKLAAWVTGIGKFIKDGLSGFLESAKEKGRDFIDGLSEGIQNGKDFVVEKASALGSAALEKVGKVGEWAGRATSAASSFGASLQASRNPIKKAAGSMIVGATNAVSGLGKTFKTYASTSASTFSGEIRKGSGPAGVAAKAMVAGAKAAFNRIKASFKSFGHDAAEGFKNGINSMISSVASKAAEMVRKAKAAAKAAQDSNSPSKDFMEFGGWAAEGYAIGLTNRKSTNLIEQNAQKMVGIAKNAASSPFGIGSMYFDSNTALGSLAYAMAQISDTLDESMDSNPTIRPIMDMSNVNRNAAAISALFGEQELRASLNASRDIQNGFEQTMARRNSILSTESIDKLANKIDSITESMNSRSLNVYNTIDGSADPEAFADTLTRRFKLNARTM